MVSSEPAVWDNTTKKKSRGKACSKSTQMIKDMLPGEVKRINHEDVNCTVCQEDEKPACTLGMAIAGLNKQPGIKYEYYHEKNKVAVVKRIS